MGLQMTKKSPKSPYGHLAVLKLSQMVGYDSTLGDAAKRIFMIIAGYASHNDYSCFPSASKIAKSLGMTHPAVTKQINILVEHQYLRKTQRSCKKTKSRQSNILTLNVALVDQYRDEPDIFCKRNEASMVMYLETLLSYGVLQLNEITSPETQKGYKKKTLQKNILKKSQEETTSNRTKIRAGAWQQEKEHESKTGLTKAHKQRLEALNTELRQHIPNNALVDFSLSVRRQVKELPPLIACNTAIERYEEKLKEVRRGGI